MQVTLLQLITIHCLVVIEYLQNISIAFAASYIMGKTCERGKIRPTSDGEIQKIGQETTGQPSLERPKSLGETR